LFTLCSANGAEFGLVVIVGAKQVIMEWTDDKVFKLIKLYESYPLYVQSHMKGVYNRNAAAPMLGPR